MSGSFWKFGQNYATESPLSKLLNRAFVKVNDNEVEKDENNSNETPNENSVEAKDTRLEISEKSDEGVNVDEGSEKSTFSAPDSESESKDYKPNLEVLDDLLDDEELYTELMCSNFKLLIFFKYPEVLSKLVEYVTNEHVLNENLEESSDNEDGESIEKVKSNVDEDEYTMDKKQEEKETVSDQMSVSSAETSITLPPESEEQVESRRARMAAEILSADVWPISSAFMDHEELLARLWSMLDHPAPLSIVASTYFMKINERLLDMDIAGMLHFILAQENLVDRFLKHIDNPPLMDFLLKVISTDKPDTPTGVIEQLKRQALISKLLDHLGPEYSSSTKSAAGDFLKALITISANSNNEIASAIGPNELTRELVSSPMVEKLMTIMLHGDTSLSNGVGIIIELIRKNNSDYDFVQVMYTTLETHPPNDRDPIYLGYLVKSASKHLPDFNEMLVETVLPPLETPFGSIEPLGFERFKICELVAELLHCSNMTLLNEPNGEEIVCERDDVRQKTLQQERSERMGNEVAENHLDAGEEVTTKMAELKLATTDSGQSSGDESVHATNDSENAGTEIHSEDSSDCEVSEKSLRDNPVVGDELKIALQDNRIITTILEMFFRFPWNNFLHNVVFDIVQQIFNGPLKTGFNRFLIADLFTGAHITQMIMEGDQKCEDYENETGLRLGYMGHLTLIAEEVAKFAAYIEEMKITFSNSAIWENLNDATWKEYTETVLADTRENYSTVLGDFGEDDEDDDHEDIEDEDEEGDSKESVLGSSDMGAYRDFDRDQDNDDDYAEYSDVDSPRYYEYEDGQGNKTKVHLNTDMDYDVGVGALTHDTEGKTHESVENDGERANKFSSYMSHQLAKDYSTSSSSDDDEEEDAWTSPSPNNFQPQTHQKSATAPTVDNYTQNDVFQSPQFGLQDDDDDYMDPNDDGQSYAKPNHPLYNHIVSQSQPNSHSYFDQKQVIVDDEDSDEDSDKEDEADEDDQYSLCRTSSKDNMAWDCTEQNRIISIANFRQNQQGREEQ